MGGSLQSHVEIVDIFMQVAGFLVSTNRCTRALFASGLVVLITSSTAAQTADPRSDFLNALGQFSLALDGTYGDEGQRLSTALDSMSASLSRWDAVIQSRERAMAAEIGNADLKLASRMHLALGGLYLDRLRVSDALKELAAARASDPSRPEVPLLQALAHAQVTNDPTAAIESLRAAHALNPQDVTRAYLLGRHLLDANQREAGLELLRQVRHDGSQTSASPGSPAPFIRLDLVREMPGIDPFLPPVLYSDAFATLQRGDLALAIAQLRESDGRDQLITLKSANDGDALARAAAAFRDGRVDDARTQLETALAEAPNRAEAHRVLAMADLADGETARGIARLRAAISLSPDDERPRVALATALLEGEQFSEAEQTLLETLKVLPASGRAHYLLGLTYQRQGNRADALRELQSALAHTPMLGANTIHAMIGTLQKDEQDLDAAAKAFTTRVDLVPNDPEAHRELGKVCFLQGDDVRARAEFEVALLLSPSDVEAYTSLGQLDLREGRSADAANVARQALEIDPGHREARYLHATALIRLGKADEGAAEMQVFQRLQAEDSEARARQFELGRLRREASVSRAAGDAANAVTLLRRALVYEPRSATSHLDLGLALLESGQTAEAIERLNTAAALNAPLDVHRHLAKAYAALGQKADSDREQALYERLKREAISRTGRAR